MSIRYYTEIDLRDFDAWSGAKYTMETLENLEEETSQAVFTILEDCMNDCGDWDETSINDFLWFETETIAEWLGYSCWEELEDEAEGKEESEIERKFSVGDIVFLDNGKTATIMKIDTDDNLPYYIKYNNNNENRDFDWIEEDNIVELKMPW